MPLDQEQVDHVKDIAELEVRKYFDHYLEDTLPTQLKVIISAHNTDDKAHGGVEKKISRFLWVVMGIGIASGASGVLASKALGVFGG